MNTANLIHASGHPNSMPAWENSRRFWVIDDRQIDDTPPTNWVGHLIAGTHCTSSRNPPDAYFDYQIYRDSDRNIHGLSVRHDHYSKPGAHQVRVDKTIEGRTWKTWLRAVTDDFGWLVEVPTC